MCQGARRHNRTWARLALVVPVVLATGGLAPPAAAQAALSLKQALDAAWLRQPEAQSMPQRREATAATAQAARRWTAEPPALELAHKTDQVVGHNRGSREWVAGVSAPLWRPGERSGTQALAQAERQALDGTQAAALWRSAGAVRNAWWATQLAAIDERLANERQLQAAQLALDVARRVKAGDLARADQHQADAAVAASQAEAALAAAAHVQVQQALFGLIGGTADTSLGPLPATSETLPPDGSTAMHPLLRELADKAQISARARALASTQRRANPELALAATRERGAFGEAYGQAVTIALRLPFGTDSRAEARAATAAAEQLEAEALLALETGRLHAEATAAKARWAAAQQVVAATAQRATLARDTRGFYDKAFQLGQADLPTRLRAELEASAAERQAARARIELAQAVSAWRQALGLLPE